jgi:bifunctional N-acetylglucosamine-1-phosphate-uridyltransferase/glucosamine-1-phosphate-acetyltransferase GlmU-like protein
MQMPGQPKALVQAGNKPLLFHTLDTLKQLSVASVNIVVGHLGQNIIDKVSVNYTGIKFSWQHELNGTAGAVSAFFAQNELEDSDYILIMNADDSWRYTKQDFDLIIDSARQTNVSLFITPDEQLQYGYYRKVILDSRGRFIELTNQPHAGEYIVCGCFLATKAKLAGLIAKLTAEPNGELGLPKILDHIPAENISAIVVPFAHWRGINTTSELNAATEASESS